uniref:Uncharacterized protein n=1 Tax=Arion vulgaris TaxID=1028688 RepID=A0A0B7B2I9_9EUPU
MVASEKLGRRKTNPNETRAWERKMGGPVDSITKRVLFWNPREKRGSRGNTWRRELKIDKG